MKNSEEMKSSWAARIRLALAGLALAGAIVGGAAAVDADPTSDQETSEVAQWGWWGFSWQ